MTGRHSVDPLFMHPTGRPSRQYPLLIVAVIVLGYCIAPLRLPLIGEEPCRAQHGIEMVESGDWTIPTNQYVPILDRPPGQYWTLAVIHGWIHPLDPLTLRLSMAIVLLATSFLIWEYARRFFSEPAAFLAAVAYPTMGHVFDLGRIVETDGEFTLLLAASLLIWHCGYERGWRPHWTWIVSLSVAAAAALTKGTQAPVAYFGTVYLFLLIRRDWRFLRDWGHFAGLGLFLLLIGIWQVPLYLQAGWEGTRMVWLDPGAGRLSIEPSALLAHLFGFPVSALVATAPWSFLLAGLLLPGFRGLSGKPRSAVLFSAIGVASVFVPVWPSIGGEPRYIMPMYPMLAILAGAVLHRTLEAKRSVGLQRLWKGYLRGMAGLLAFCAVVFVIATVIHPSSEADWARTLSQPLGMLVVVLSATAVSIVVLFRVGGPDRARLAVVQTFVLAALLCVFFNGPVLNAIALDTGDPGPEVVALRARLPPDASLVSFEPLHPKFVYWYQKRIPIVDLATAGDDVEHFAVNGVEGRPVDLPFDWEPLDEIVMDTRRDPSPVVVVGRRVRSAPPTP